VTRCKYEDNADRYVKKRKKRKERSQTRHHVVKNREKFKLFDVVIHTL
jgi:hypothetical protein